VQDVWGGGRGRFKGGVRGIIPQLNLDEMWVNSVYSKASCVMTCSSEDRFCKARFTDFQTG